MTIKLSDDLINEAKRYAAVIAVLHQNRLNIGHILVKLLKRTQIYRLVLFKTFFWLSKKHQMVNSHHMNLAKHYDYFTNNFFKKSVKKLNANQKIDLDEAVKAVIEGPSLGQQKMGDLTNVCVYKFKMAKQLTLLAYSFEDQSITLILLALGTH